MFHEPQSYEMPLASMTAWAVKKRAFTTPQNQSRLGVIPTKFLIFDANLAVSKQQLDRSVGSSRHVVTDLRVILEPEQSHCVKHASNLLHILLRI